MFSEAREALLEEAEELCDYASDDMDFSARPITVGSDISSDVEAQSPDA